MRKGQVKIYELNQEGTYDFKESIKDIRRYEELDELSYSPEKVSDYSDGLPEQINKILCTNPFLFKKDESNEKYIISIEDFYVDYKQKKYPLGTVIRTQLFTRRERKKIFLKNYKVWVKDAKQRIKKVFKESEQNIDVASKHNLVNLGFLNILMLLTGAILPILFFTKVVDFLYVKNNIVKYILIGCIALSFIGIICGVLHSRKCRAYKNYVRKQKKLHKKYSKEVNKDFNKNSKYLKKHYSSCFKNRIMKKPPLPIRRVVIGGDKIDYLENISIEISKRSMEILRINEGFNPLYRFSVLLSYATCFISIGYTLYLVVLYLYKILFAKGE